MFRVFAFSVLVVLSGFGSAAAEPKSMPGAPHLLPKDTLVYARLDNADDFREDLKSSSVGRMLEDPKLKPFAGDFYRTVANLFETVSNEVGVSLDELLSIPSGQVAVAMMPRNLVQSEGDTSDGPRDESPEAIQRRLAQKRRQQTAVAGLFIIEAGENVDKLMAIVERLEQRFLDGGYVRRVSSVDKIQVVRLLPPRSGRPEIEYFEHQNTVIFGIGHQTAAKSLDLWLERSSEPTLADNVDFGNLMSRCIGAESTRPQVTFFADPYHILERLVKRGGAAALVWPLIEELGITKLRGVGGSSFRGGETFQDITHFHLLIDSPRDGFFGVLRPETGEITAPNWVPADVTAYTTFHWNFSKTYENLDKILAKFQGESPLQRFVEEPFQKASRLSFQEDIVDNLTGRYASTTWLQPPVKLNSQVTAYALELKDTEKAKSAIARFREHSPAALDVDTVAGTVVYRSTRTRRQLPDTMRAPEPSMAIIGNWIVFSDSRSLIERCIQANVGSLPGLIDVAEFDLVLGELGGKLDGEKPFMISFVRGAEYLRQIYELAKSSDSRSFLRNAGERNVVARTFADMLQRNELPPFEQFEQYFAPGGVFGYDEPNGIHFGSFNLNP